MVKEHIKNKMLLIISFGFYFSGRSYSGNADNFPEKKVAGRSHALQSFE